MVYSGRNSENPRYLRLELSKFVKIHLLRNYVAVKNSGFKIL